MANEVSTQSSSLQTAVLLLVFNRPDTTKEVFEAIRQARPPRLYVSGDGPRVNRAGESDRVARSREIATAVDWPCELKTHFGEVNLGCKKAVSGGIDWFFKNEERGIILEDDCLPNADFFRFCEELLGHYSNDERVSVITGDNFQDGQQRGEGSYYFSKYNHCWGWASWRRAWQHYQGDLPFWPTWSRSSEWRKVNPDTVERQYWARIFEAVRDGRIDSWAYPWLASVWFQGGLTVTPNVNLVSNIGFGSDSTHTSNTKSPLSNRLTQKLGILVHTKYIVQDVVADRYVFDFYFGGRNLRFPRSILRYARRIVGLLFRGVQRGLG